MSINVWRMFEKSRWFSPANRRFRREMGIVHSCRSRIVERLENRVLLAATGSLDSAFGQDGRVTTDFGKYEAATSMAIDPRNGKIVVAGLSEDGSQSVLALARYNADGSLDASFAADGTQTAIPFSLTPGIKIDVAIDRNGKIVVAGSVFNGADLDFGVARFNANGSLDGTFGRLGRQITSFGSNAEVTGVAIDANGKIVVAGTHYTESGQDFALVRYLANGSLDTSFGNRGKQTTSFFGDFGEDVAADIVIAPNGQIIVAGTTSTNSGVDFALAKFNSNGSLDTNFGEGGRLITDFGGNDDRANSVVIDANDRIVVAGDSSSFLLAARYNADGSLDSSFDEDGKLVSFPFSVIGRQSGAEGMSVAIDPSGKIVFAGSAHDNSTFNFGVARYNTDGTPDFNFGDFGHKITDIGGGARTNVAAGIAIDGSGNIVVAGWTDGGNPGDPSFGTGYDFAVARYLSSASTSLAISATDASKPEGQSDVTEFIFTVTRSGDASAEATIDYAVTKDDQSSLDDFAGSIFDTLTFVAGETSKTITVLVQGDLDTEVDEDFRVTLSEPSDGANLLVASAIGTIIDDDFFQATFVANGRDLLNATVVGGLLQVKVNNVVDIQLDGVDPALISKLTIIGGSGADAINLSGLLRANYPALRQIILIGGAGNDRIIGSDEFGETITGGLGDDLLHGGLGGDDQLVESGSTKMLTLRLTDNSLKGLGNDRVTNFERAVLTGSNKSDRLDASSFTGQVTMFGGDGNDVLLGGSNFALLDGGDGSDRLQALAISTNSVTLLGGDGSDTLQGATGADLLFGGEGSDRLKGGAGDDLLIGGFGSDAIDGELGNDVALGGQGGQLRGGRSRRDSGDSFVQIEFIEEAFSTLFDWD